VPPATVTGSYYLIACADAAGAVVETSETNNCRSAAIKVGADLAVSALTAPATTGAGQVATVSDTTKNQGGAGAGGSQTRFYLSLNTAVDGADVILGNRAVVALAAGASEAASSGLTIPAGTATGTYYLLACADAAGVIAETVESNNCRHAMVRIGPDLLVAALTVPATATPGATITVSDTTRNQGAGSAATSETRFYLSANTVLDAADLALGSRVVPALAGGARHAGTTLVTIPAMTALTRWYVLAAVDAAAAISETSEGNNTTFRAITLN
jgi:hypothetical protein